MVKVIYKRNETISISQVRQLCIRNNFYTCGSVAEYENLFRMCAEYDGTIEQLSKIAGNIIEHSDCEELADYGFDTFYEVVAWVMRLITQEAMFISYEAQEVE